MKILNLPWGALHYADTGPSAGPAFVFANSLGTDLRLWDDLLPLLPNGARAVRFDKRGHGLSDFSANVSVDDYADDAIALIEHLGLPKAVFVGLSIGGLIAQSIAARRPELLRALVLSNTAVKIGNAEMWNTRIAAIEADGIGAIADGVMERWFAPVFRATPALRAWRNMLARTPADGYIAACRAINAADYTGSTSRLRLPALVFAGDCDGSTPPELVKATAALIPGAKYHCIRDAAHIPCVEKPDEYAEVLNGFVMGLAHV